MRHLTFLLCLLSFGCGSDVSPAAPQPEPATPIGLWVVRSEQVDEVRQKAEAKGKDRRNVSYPSAFFYDGRTVTLKVIHIKAADWLSPDEYYRLTAEIIADELYVRLPLGNWTYLATFRDGAFEIQEEEVTWRLNRVPEDRASTSCQPLLKPRDVFDYRLTEPDS